MACHGDIQSITIYRSQAVLPKFQEFFPWGIQNRNIIIIVIHIYSHYATKHLEKRWHVTN